ncbi:MAG: GC-type dockerin domain-anchored protein [Phycisphaerales bacterium JB060]
MYDQAGGQLSHSQTIVPHDIKLHDNFGFGLDVDGDRLAIGSLYTQRSGSDERAGAVFIYEHDGERWVETDRIEPPAEVDREFGAVVELHGRTLIVHEFRMDRFWVYHETASGWELVQLVLPPVPVSLQAAFGFEWAVNGDWFVTSAYLDRSVTPSGGSLYFYKRRPGGTLDFVQKVAATEAMYLGITMDFADDTLAVGAPYASRGVLFQGVVQLYEFDGDQWVLDGELVQREPRETREFGYTLVADEGRMFVRSINEYTPVSRGMVHLFERQADGSWLQTERMEPNPVEYADHYGSAMALAGDRLLVGANRDQSPSGGLTGAAYFFDLTCTDCPADLDADGALTIYDFLTFQNLFDAGDPLADFDSDGELTIFDFLAFQSAFDAGCA